MIQKRNAVLDLNVQAEEKPEPKQKKTVKPQTATVVEVKPTYNDHQVVGKAKKKFLFTFVNAQCLNTACQVLGKDKVQAIESALLYAIEAKDPQAFEQVKQAIANEGGEVK